jgi:hypothetical protein
MNIQTALLPHKHTAFSKSLLGTAGLLLTVLDEPRSLDELLAASRGDGWPNKLSYTEVLLGVYVLFAIKQIRLVQGDRIQKAGSANETR